MKVEIISEFGYLESLLGLGLSHGLTSEFSFIDFYPHPGQEEFPETLFTRLEKIALRLSQKDSGHNKFLESIYLWLDITAPLFWWKQFDTYRTGVSKQSESTMHTLGKRPLTQEDFDSYLEPRVLGYLNFLVEKGDFISLNSHLPQSFRQRRIVSLNYKTLRNMISQRASHKLYEWTLFVETILSQANHPEFLPHGEMR